MSRQGLAGGPAAPAWLSNAAGFVRALVAACQDGGGPSPVPPHCRDSAQVQDTVTLRLRQGGPPCARQGMKSGCCADAREPRSALRQPRGVRSHADSCLCTRGDCKGPAWPGTVEVGIEKKLDSVREEKKGPWSRAGVLISADSAKGHRRC